MNDKVRMFWIKLYATKGKPSVQAWEKAIGQDIVEVVLAIPRRPTILEEWDIYKENLHDKMPKNDIQVTLRMPLYLCGMHNTAMASEEKNEFGCRTLDTLDVTRISEDVPFVVYVHGGGLTGGTQNDSTVLELVQSISGATSKALVLASVSYSLAPEHPFPCAPVEALTVMAYLMETMPNRSFHIIGVSAGANLAAVAGMEMLRREPQRLASLAVWSPMMNPAADSNSF